MTSTLIRTGFTFLLACAALTTSARADEPPAAPANGRVTGIGGIFIKAKDPKALVAWYRDVLGVPVQSWGGAIMRYDAANHPPALAWNVFPATTKYFAPSTSDTMINYAVEGMDALLDRLKDKGVTILKRDDSDPNGRFAWVLDPEGNKVELWEPKSTK